MPKDYWKWWWSGFAVVVAITALNNVAFEFPDSRVRFLGVPAFLTWVALAIVAWRRNNNSPKTFSFWWSLAALGIYLVLAVVITFLPFGGQMVLVALWGLIWIAGGIAVIIIWLVGKSRQRTPPEPTVKACPYCAEMIKVAAIKCKHCGELLTSSVDNSPDA